MVCVRILKKKIHFVVIFKYLFTIIKEIIFVSKMKSN